MNISIVSEEQANLDYQRVEQAIEYLEEHYQEQPSLGEVAANIGLSEYHFQRLFTRWVGVSPKRFLQYLTKEHAKQLLERSTDLLQAAYESGLSGPGRLHDLFVSTEAVTPGEYKQRGEGLTIRYGFHPTPFGEALLACTERGISNLIFVRDEDRSEAVEELRRSWHQAEIVEDAEATAPLAEQLVESLQGDPDTPLALHLTGTNFQIKVWEALLRIPAGSVTTYEEVAAAIGKPSAARAVSNAVGANPIPVLIPCHRVIRKSGDFGGYHYGAARKKALLGWEMSRAGEKIERTI